MRLTNSYVFIPKKGKKVRDNTIQIVESIPRKFEKFFNIDSEQIFFSEIETNSKKFSKDLLNKYNKIISGTFLYTINDVKMNICYKFTKANDVYYLDITINDLKNNIIQCFEMFNDIFLTSNEFTNSFITILSYDYVSEHYCNKIYPLLNKFERKFRKLLFLIFTSQFKELYFETTAPKEMVNGTKKKIKIHDDIYRIQNYFYSLDIGTLRSYLFDKNWTSIEEKQKEEILNKDLSKISSENLKKIIKNIEPKSNWDRFFQNKGFSEDIDKTMAEINDLRNIVAHNKIMSKVDYDLLFMLLEKNIKVVDKAICITEQVDFKIINRNKRIEMIEKFNNILVQAINDISTNIHSSFYEKTSSMLKDILNNKKTIYEQVGEQINKMMNNDES